MQQAINPDTLQPVAGLDLDTIPAEARQAARGMLTIEAQRAMVDAYAKARRADEAAQLAHERHGRVKTACEAAQLLETALQRAHEGTDPVASLVLLPLIADIVRVKAALGAVESAMGAQHGE